MRSLPDPRFRIRSVRGSSIPISSAEIRRPSSAECWLLYSLREHGWQIASYYGWPVSTTHSIVGAIIGFGILYAIEAPPKESKLDHGNSLPKVGQIVSSWVISPLLSATISYLTFKLLLKNIFYQKNPLQATKRLAPLLVFIVMTILTMTMVFKGLKNIDLDLELVRRAHLHGSRIRLCHHRSSSGTPDQGHGPCGE